MACGHSMGVHPIFNILRIDNVETEPAERITANDEERQRQGFDIQTVFAWSERDGVPDVETAVARDPEGPFLAHRLRARARIISRDQQGTETAQREIDSRLRHRPGSRALDQRAGRRR